MEVKPPRLPAREIIVGRRSAMSGSMSGKTSVTSPTRTFRKDVSPLPSPDELITERRSDGSEIILATVCSASKRPWLP